MALVPFRLEAQLLRGVCAETYSLDLAGILSSRLWRQRKHLGNIDSMIEQPQDFDLPLDICDEGTDWHWMTTCGQFNTNPKYPQEPRTFYRVVNDSWVSRAANRPLPYYHPKSSAYRDVMMPAPVILTPNIKWYGVGDIGKIYELVKDIRCIGKRRSKGEGVVLKWKIEEAECNDKWRYGHVGEENQIIRPIPVECAERLEIHYQLAWYAIRPPSWNPNRLRSLAVKQEEEVYLPEAWEL